MRYTKKELHPQIFDAIQKFSRAIAYSYAQNPKENLEAYNNHQKAWWKQYGKSFLLGAGAWTAAATGSIVWAAAAENPWLVGLTFLLFGGMMTHGIVAYIRNKDKASAEELEALLPTLELSALQRDYCEAFLSLVGSSSIDPLHRDEILGQMNTLLDESKRLEDQRGTLSEYLGASEQRDFLAKEIERLQGRVDSAQDSIARETFQSSLEIAKKRLERYGAGAPVLERIEAQLELIRQTMGSFREVLTRLQSTPTREEIDLGALRDRIGQIQQQGSLLESAYEEIRALA